MRALADAPLVVLWNIQFFLPMQKVRIERSALELSRQKALRKMQSGIYCYKCAHNPRIDKVVKKIRIVK